MRPGDFSPGNDAAREPVEEPVASMRPGDFSPGNMLGVRSETKKEAEVASMRPGDFSPGNTMPRRSPPAAAPLQ